LNTALEIFNFKSLGLTGLECKLTDILHPNDFQGGVDFLQNVSKYEQAVVTLRVSYGDNFRFYEFKGQLFKNKAQETKYLITARDVTLIKKKEEELKKLAKNMQEIRFWKLLQTKDEKSSFQKSREVLNQIIDNIKEAYFEVDLEGNFTFMNKSFTQMYGYSFDEMIGKNYEQLMDDENKVKVFKIFNSVYKSGLPQENVQFEIIQKGNKKAIVETSVYLNKNTSGKKIGFYGITRDITQRFNLELKLKQSEEELKILNKELEKIVQERTKELRESEEKFRTITEYSTVGIVIIQDGKVKYVNKAMLDINEFTMDEMMLWTPKEFINNTHPEDRKRVIKDLTRRQTGNSDLSVYSSYRILTKHGKTKWIDTYSKTITYLGQFANLALITDVTEQKRAQEKLKESEEKFRTIAESSLMGIAILQDNKVKYINLQFATLAGYDVDEAKEFSPMDIFQSIHPDDRKLVMEQLRKKQRGLKDYVSHYQYRIFDKKGGIKWLDNYSKTINFMGRPADLVSVIDITDRRKAEHELKESEEKYRHLYENSPFSIVLLNDEGKIIDMNPKTTGLFGYKKEDLIGKNYLTLANIFPKETIPGLRLVQDLMTKGEPSDPIMKPQITKIYSKDQKPMWVASELSTVTIGGELMILAIIQDITEKKNAEEKLKESERILRQQYIELKELDKLKTDFISIAAHDLKTPLISVGGYVDLILLREKELKEDVKEDLNRVLNNVHRLDGYINRLLDVMKIEAKKVEIVKREENIHDIIITCLSDLEFQVSQKNLTVKLNVSENLEMRVDNFRISQALLNLLSNAIKFTPQNGKIDISIVEQGENVLFKIKDNGKGLTPEEIQKLFGKFVTIEQGVDGYSTFDKGSGLGLYITRGFIEAHGGKIWVESEGRDLGAEFSFTLPK